jgi:translocation and assembly module TamB
MRIPYLSSMQVALRRILILTALVGLGLFFYTQTDSFQRQVRDRVVQVLEQATGARITLQGFHTSVWDRVMVLHGVTVRARGTLPGSPPFFQAEAVLVQMRLSTLFIAEKELSRLRIERPRIAIVFDATGRTNVPQPSDVRDPRRSPLDPLFNLAVRRLEVVDGLWIWNDQSRKMDFSAENATASMAFEPARDRYAGAVSIRSAELRESAGDAPHSSPSSQSSHLSHLAWTSRVRFFLDRRTLEITDGSFESGHTSVKAQATLRDFRNPVLQAGFEVAVDLAEAGALFQQPALHEGLLTAKGSLRFDHSKGGLHVSGDARLERATLLSFHDLRASAAFEATSDTVIFQPFQCEALGGRAQGRMRISSLGSAPRYSIEARVTGLSYARLAEAIEALYPSVPLTRPRIMTAISGDTEISFGGGAAVEVALRGTLTEPGATPPGYLPVHGHTDMHLVAGNEYLVLRDTELLTPASRLTAEGAGRFHVTLSTTDVKEFEWVGKLPAATIQRADFDGTLSGPLRSLQFDGRAGLEGLSWMLAGKEYAFDAFHGDVALAPGHLEIHDGRLERGTSQILFNAAAPLVEGTIPETAAINASAELRQWDAKDLLAWLKLELPMSGAVRGAVTAGGTLALPAARGSLEIVNGQMWGESFDSLAANVVWSAGRFEANNIRGSRGRARLTGSFQYRDDTSFYSFQASGTNLALRDFPRIQNARLTLGGVADVQTSGSGLWNRNRIAPNGRATLTVRDLTVNGEAAGAVTGSVEADGARALFLFRATPVATSGTASSTLTGEVALQEPYVFQSKAQAMGIDLDPLLMPWIKEHITRHGHFEGDAALHGELQHLEKTSGSIEVRSWDIGLENVDLRNDGVWRATLQDKIFKLEPSKLTGKDFSATLQGVMGPPSAPAGAPSPGAPASWPMDLRLDGNVNLKLLETWQPGIYAGGTGRLHLRLEGTTDSPQWGGSADLEEAQVGSETFPNSLNHMNGALLFNKTGVRIVQLTGETGGGRMNLTGVLDYTRSPLTFQIHAEARDVRMRYPSGVSTVLNADLNLTGTPQRNQLTGDITILRAGINANFDLAEALAQVKQASTAPSEVSWARSMGLFVRVVSSPDIRFESGSTRNLEAQLDLRVRGTLADPALLGDVNILDGHVTFGGTEYSINRGDIQFLNPFRIDPIISMDVSTRKQKYDISLDFTGPLDKLRVNYRSDPPLPVSDIQLLLVLGRTPQSSAAEASNPALAQIGSNTMLSDTTAATADSRLGRFFGASRFKIDPQSGSPDITNPTARVSLEQQVTPNVTFTYITGLNNAQEQIVQIEWIVNRRISVLATRDQNGVFAVDFKIRKQVR